MPDTIFTQDINEIKKFFKNHKKVIIKPVHSFGGNDIRLLTKFNKILIKKLINKHSFLMCQKNIYQT